MPQPLTAVPADLPTFLAATPDLPFDPDALPGAELERQVATYLALGFAALLGLDEAGFRALVAPAVGAAPAHARSADADGVPADDHAAVLLVLDVDVNDAVPAMRRGHRTGVSVLDRDEAAAYLPLPDVVVPPAPYLVLGVDTGTRLRDVPPRDALVTIREARRTPLTLAEGVALAVVRPDLLRPNRCFSLLGSRADNLRVPAVWISERRAKLGWCWDGNPHTWLGAASARERVGGGALPAG